VISAAERLPALGFRPQPDDAPLGLGDGASLMLASRRLRVAVLAELPPLVAAWPSFRNRTAIRLPPDDYRSWRRA